MNRKTSGIVADTSELKRLIAEHPDYSICVAASENANCGDYYWMYCSDVRFGVGEILDCEQPVNDEKIFCDRDDFEEELGEWLWDEMLCELAADDPDPTEADFQRRLAEEKAKYEPYWKRCIVIYADN